jgi:glutamate--cysteine ligase
MITYQTLIDDLASGCKPKDQFRIGLEHEQFAYNIETDKPLSYDGKPGILQLLEAFSEAYGWKKITDHGHVIALKNGGDYITLEPGGQFEYSGAPMLSVSDAKDAMDKFYDDLAIVAQKLGIGFLAKGFHPMWKLEEIHKMPKPRYDIMGPYMDRIKSMGKNMMYRSCGTQVNLDHSSEAEMVKNLRLSLAIQPVVIALMANSSEVEGKDTGYSSYRSYIWNNTDPDRCGILPFAFDEDMGFARYIDYALDVPMYFIRRDGEYADVSGRSFRDFMDGKLSGYEGEYPTMDDWNDHLTTLFPEVRLKHYLELRGADCHEPKMVYAMAAFWAELFYDEVARDKVWELVKDWSVDDHQTIRDTVPKMGLDTSTPDGRDLSALAADILSILSDDYLKPYEEVLAAHKK